MGSQSKPVASDLEAEAQLLPLRAGFPSCAGPLTFALLRPGRPSWTSVAARQPGNPAGQAGDPVEFQEAQCRGNEQRISLCKFSRSHSWRAWSSWFPLALFVDPLNAFWVGVILWIAYAAIGIRAVTVDQPADPNNPMSWGLDVAFHGWGDAKGLGVTAIALFICTVLLLVILLIWSF